MQFLELYDITTIKSLFIYTQFITAKIQETERQLRVLTERHAKLLNWRNSLNEIRKMEKFTIQSLPEIIMASHREVIPNYESVGAMCCNTIGPEMQRLGCKCPPPGYCFTIEHNEEYTPTNIDIEYCEQVESMGDDSDIIQFKVIPGVPKAVCMKHYGPYDRLCHSYVQLFKYIEEHNYTIVGKPRCSYVDGIWNQDDPEQWLSIIQVPVR